jgi:hypothetical protein
VLRPIWPVHAPDPTANLATFVGRSLMKRFLPQCRPILYTCPYRTSGPSRRQGTPIPSPSTSVGDTPRTQRRDARPTFRRAVPMPCRARAPEPVLSFSSVPPTPTGTRARVSGQRPTTHRHRVHRTARVGVVEHSCRITG